MTTPFSSAVNMTNTRCWIQNKNTHNIVVEPGEPSKNTQLEDIYAWVDGFKLNKRKKTIRRDFSDAGNS